MLLPGTAKADTHDLKKLRKDRIAKAEAEARRLAKLSASIKRSGTISDAAMAVKSDLKAKRVGHQEAFNKLVILNERANTETPGVRGDNTSVRSASKKIAKGLIIKDPKNPQQTIVVESKAKELGLKMPPKPEMKTAKAPEAKTSGDTKTKILKPEGTKTAASKTEDTRSEAGKSLATIIPSNVTSKE